MGVVLSRVAATAGCTSMSTAVTPGSAVVVFCGPSGSGKSTLVSRLQSEFPGVFSFSVSHTTRAARPGERDGVHYHYVSRDYMRAAVDRGDFLEHAEFSGNMYGTSVAEVRRLQAEGSVCILDIDVQGVKQVKQHPALQPQYVFIRPPSMQALELRLRARQTETEQSLQKRLRAAAAEIEYGIEPGNMDVVIVNDVLDVAYEQLRHFLMPLIHKQQAAYK